MNGFIKDGANETVDDPERRRVRGVAAQSVLAAFQFFAANLRKTGQFMTKPAAGADKVCKLLRRRWPRSTHLLRRVIPTRRKALRTEGLTQETEVLARPTSVPPERSAGLGGEIRSDRDGSPQEQRRGRMKPIRTEFCSCLHRLSDSGLRHHQRATFRLCPMPSRGWGPVPAKRPP